jgi:hypothetical protein
MQLERGEVLGLTLALVAVAIALVVAPAPQTPAPPAAVVLSAIPDSFRRYDVTLLIELPDSGGYLANGSPLDLRHLPARLNYVSATRPQFPRFLFVRVNPRRPPADLLLVISRAESVGWRVFDADKSGLPVYGAPLTLPRSP